MRTRGGGFTLAELLASLSVISVLAAILFPVFAKAREKARQFQCSSNLQQIGTALALYAHDYNGHLPPRRDDLGPLQPRYLPDGRVVTCPSAPADRGAPPPPGSPPTSRRVTYIYREGFCDDDAPQTPLMADPALETHNGGANVLFADGHAKWFAGSKYLAGGAPPPPPAPAGAPGMLPGLAGPPAPMSDALDAFKDWYGPPLPSQENYGGPSIGGAEE